MKPTLIMVLAMLIGGSALATGAARAQAPAAQPGSKRTPLQQADLSAAGREVIQVRVDFDPGYVAPWHTHPGEEIIYVLEGTIEYQVQGKTTKTYKPGEVLIVPYGTPHTAKNVGTTNAAELATYVVEKGKPLITLLKDQNTSGQ